MIEASAFENAVEAYKAGRGAAKQVLNLPSSFGVT
jgi:hypothetical protein